MNTSIMILAIAVAVNCSSDIAHRLPNSQIYILPPTEANKLLQEKCASGWLISQDQVEAEWVITLTCAEGVPDESLHSQ